MTEFNTRYGILSEMKIYEDSNTEPMLVGYKGVENDGPRYDDWLAKLNGGIGTTYATERPTDAACFYAPYIPLTVAGAVSPHTMEQVPDVYEVEGEWAFVLRRTVTSRWFDGAQQAFDWIMENTAPGDREFREMDRENRWDDMDVKVRFLQMEKAALFKLMCL